MRCSCSSSEMRIWIDNGIGVFDVFENGGYGLNVRQAKLVG